MYQCHVHCYFVGKSCKMWEIIKEMPPFLHFTHEFWESRKPEKNLVAKADLILADFQEVRDPDAWEILVSGMAHGAELIFLIPADIPQPWKANDLFGDELYQISDIWTTPMSDEEVRFRFQRWQKAYKMSKDLWQTSHYLEETINHIPNLIWYKDKNGIHEKVNDSFCRTVNKTKAQVEGRGHAYIWDVEHDDPACIESEQKVMDTRQTCISEETIKTGDGTRLLTTYKSPLYNLDGSVMGTVGVAIDITRERIYEQEIIQKNQMLETIFTAMDCGIMCHTLDGSQVLSINRAALNILDYESLEEMLADGFDMVAASVVEEDRENLRMAIQELKAEGDTISTEYRVRHKNGEIRHVMGNVKLLKENGKLMYQRFLLDCTAQKLQEKENEQRQVELIQALSIDYNLVCFFDLHTGEGKLLRMEDKQHRFFGSVFDGELQLDKNMEQYVRQFVYEEDRSMLREAVSQENLQKELAQKKQCYINYRTVSNGEMEYFQVKAVRAGSWEVNHGIVLGFRSVDEEIRNEMEKKSLLEDALLQANRANKAKSTFLSNMSHDIRTPMNAIVGFTTLALSHIENQDKVEAYLGKIMTSGNHLLSLINDVLDMSRIESGKMHLEEKPCSLPDILHSLYNIVQADVHSKQLELYMDTVDVFDEEIYCDKLRLNQVLLNLLSNSVKYTGAGGIINIRLTEKSGAPAGYANYEFSIQDTGIGMSEEFVTHIFEPFEREKNTTTSGIQGTGLGMAITKNIVDMMRGSIEVRSKQGVGTEFIVSFTFRLCREETEVQDIPALKNCRALVVDDDFNTCDSVSYMLGQMGMRAEWTLSGKEAVLRTRQSVMRGDNYSVYVVDWLLPDMNGIEVTRRIRKEIGEEAPVIVLTAYDWSDVEEEAKEAGVSAFCSKPLFLSELKRCLNSIFNTNKKKTDQPKHRGVQFTPGRLLLAEDNLLNQEIAVEILGDAGFTVDVAENGQTVVDMLTASAPGYYQLILMDIQMPVMNGYEAAKKIRKLENPKLASIPILAMTANAFEEDRQESMRCGMNGHIAKPIDVPLLFASLDKILN